MEELDEGVLDFLKRLWHGVAGKQKPAIDDDEIEQDDLRKIQKGGKGITPDGYGGIEDVGYNDPQLKQKLARIFVRGLRLHSEAQKLGVYDEELLKFLVGVWRGKITLSQFLDLKQSGTIDRIYSRVRARVRYRRERKGMYYEANKKD